MFYLLTYLLTVTGRWEYATLRRGRITWRSFNRNNFATSAALALLSAFLFRSVFKKLSYNPKGLNIVVELKQWTKFIRQSVCFVRRQIDIVRRIQEEQDFA